MDSLFLSGAEHPTWRKLLIECGARNVALSFSSLRVRLPKNKPYSLSERLPDEVGVLLEPGALARRGLSDPELDAWTADYHQLVEDNAKRLALAVEVDAYGDRDRVLEHREEFWSRHRDIFVPLWRPEDGWRELQVLAARHGRVAITAETLGKYARQVRPMVATHGGKLHVVGSADLEALERSGASTASTLAWLSPMRHGDTVVWEDNKLRWYPAEYRDEARRRHRATWQQAGFDAELIAAGDADEVTKATIWALLEMEDAQIVATEGWNPPAPDPEIGMHKLATTEQGVRNSELDVHQDEEPRRQKILPILSVAMQEQRRLDDEDGEVVEQVPVLGASAATMLGCDACPVAGLCPEYKPAQTCAYELPVSMKTEEDSRRFLSLLKEIQAKRVLRSVFFEELRGGASDPEVNANMQLYAKLDDASRRASEDRASVRLTVEAQGNAGMISRIFGGGVASRMQEIDHARQALPAGEVIDADVVE